MVPGFNLTVSRNFHFEIICLCSSQVVKSHANEINNDIHLANTLFKIKVRWTKYGYRFQWFITVHVSFKVAYTSGLFFKKKIMEAVPNIFFTNKLLSD